MSLRISQRERAAPRAAKHQPAIYAQMLAKFFNVVDKMPGRVVFEICVRRASPRASLLEEDNAVDVGIEEAAVVGNESSAWSTMKEDGRLTGRITALFVIELV